jgi:hypothetical protein
MTAGIEMSPYMLPFVGLLLSIGNDALAVYNTHSATMKWNNMGEHIIKLHLNC